MSSKPPPDEWDTKAYWPWPIAFAFILDGGQPGTAMSAAAEALDVYSGLNGFSEYAAAAAVGRVYEVRTGRGFKAHPVEGVERLRDGSEDTYTIRTGEQVYWDEVEALESPLVSAIQHGRLTALGRRKASAALSPIRASDWVGAEIDPANTSDLVRAGFRSADLLSAALEEVKRHVLFYDIHFAADDIRTFCASLEDADTVSRPLAVSASRWQQQRVSNQQRDAFAFFDAARAFLPGGSNPASKLDLHTRYLAWLTKQRGAASAYRRTAFEKMLGRHNEGWRIEAGRWKLTQ